LRLAVPADEIPRHAGEFILYGVKKLPVEW
jgi:hypothetical protein